jgi:hypothetical protein
MGRVDHLCIGRPSAACKLSEKEFPDPALRPAREAIIDRCVRPVLRWTILPTAATLEDMHDPANHATIVLPFDAAHISRQVRLKPSPLFIAQPKQVLAHDPDPFQKRIRIVLSALKN